MTPASAVLAVEEFSGATRTQRPPRITGSELRRTAKRSRGVTPHAANRLRMLSGELAEYSRRHVAGNRTFALHLARTRPGQAWQPSMSWVPRARGRTGRPCLLHECVPVFLCAGFRDRPVRRLSKNSQFLALLISVVDVNELFDFTCQHGYRRDELVDHRMPLAGDLG